MKKAINKITFSTVLKAMPIIIIWALFFIVPQNEVFEYSINPENGLWSIFTGALLHANYSHIINNTALLVILLPILNKHKEGYKYYTFLALAYIVPSLAIYIGGQPTVGISGLVYALYSYSIIKLSLRENITIFVILFCMTGNVMLEGLFPIRPYVSWIGHSSGAILGLLLILLEQLKTKK